MYGFVKLSLLATLVVTFVRARPISHVLWDKDQPIGRTKDGIEIEASGFGKQDAEFNGQDALPPSPPKSESEFPSNNEAVDEKSNTEQEYSKSFKKGIFDSVFGRCVPHIFGTDDRVRVRVTNHYPWTAHATLEFTLKDGSIRYGGSAWFVCADTLMTAGHIVYNRGPVKSQNGWVTKIKVFPGRDGGYQPFPAAEATHWWSVKGWVRGGSKNYDYGMIKIGTDLGKETGWLGALPLGAKDLLGKTFHTVGYPGDKLPFLSQWYTRPNVQQVAPRRIVYDAEGYCGQSGSAVYALQQRYLPWAVGIHTHGEADAQGHPVATSATRITAEVVRNIIFWCKTPKKY